MTRDTTALVEVLDALAATVHPSPDGLRRIRDLIQARTAAQVAPWAAARQAVYLEGRTAMSTISEGHEDISILGTGINKIPGKAAPKFEGLNIGEDGVAVASVTDGALCIEVDDIDLAIAHRDAWQHAVAAMVMHRHRKADRS